MRVLVIGLGKMGNLYLDKVNGFGIAPANIIGVDTDPAKVKAAKDKYPEITFVANLDAPIVHYPTGDQYDEMEVPAFVGVTAAIVATNTPSHTRVVKELIERGIKWILCEKPLGLSLAAIEEIEQSVNNSGARVYTAFLMNFSGAIAKVMDLMKEHGLIMVEGSVTWGKNRYYDSRPTPGDLEDEAVHGFGILHTLIGVNQRVRLAEVVGLLTHPNYADPKAQEKAHAMDPSFPLRVNASTMALEVIATDRAEVKCVLHSSFIHGEESRKVTVVLADKNDPSAVRYAVTFAFDKKMGSTIVDMLTLTKLAGNVILQEEFPSDKLGVQTVAFLTAASGGVEDSRLTSFDEARKAVAFAETVVRSTDTGSFEIVR